MSTRRKVSIEDIDSVYSLGSEPFFICLCSFRSFSILKVIEEISESCQNVNPCQGGGDGLVGDITGGSRLATTRIRDNWGRVGQNR